MGKEHKNGGTPEQQMIRDWVEAQSNQQGDLKALLERLLEQRAS